jgi:hypothetical protein
MAVKTYAGSCHCGAVRFEADIDLRKGVNKCNCSLCTKARAWFAIVPREHARLLTDASALTDYQWVPPGRTHAFLHFQFCKICGIRGFGRGGDEFCFVNIAALDGVDPDELALAPTNYVDGRNDKYDQVPADIRLM